MLPSDVPATHWAAETVKQALASGLVQGYGDGSFKPDRTITRAEFATLLGRAFSLKAEGAEPAFADDGQIPAWAKPHVAGAVAAGVITGYDDGTFRADRGLTRSEMAVMIVRLLGLEPLPDAAPPFSDWDRSPVWARPYIAAVYEQGLMQGMGNNRFAPARLTTRAEAVTLLLAIVEETEQGDE